MTFYAEILKAIDTGNLEQLRALHGDRKKLLKEKVIFSGGTWMDYAAAHGTPEILEWLEDLGFERNKPRSREKDRPVCSAAGYGNVATLRWLLERGVTLDTDASVRNPLFAAIVRQSAECVQILLDAGIDATVRYTSPTMEDMDAMAFALFRGRHYRPSTSNLAVLIARHLAKGDEAEMARLLDGAEVRARKNGAPELIRLIPTSEELARMSWDRHGNLITE